MKKSIGILLALLLGIAALLGIAGCNEEEMRIPAEPGFYTLQEAYDNGYLLKKDLEQIAYYNNNLISCPEPLDESVAAHIKEAKAEILRTRENNPIPYAKAEGIIIDKYYGVYNNCYATISHNTYLYSPAVALDVWDEIGGIKFHYTSSYTISIWAEKD